MRRPSVSNVIVVLAALFVGVTLAQESDGPVIVTEVREVTPQALRDSVDELRMERDGIVARLRGIESRPPRVILKTDTLVMPPDTVYSFVDVRGGTLTFDVFARADSLSVRELHQGVDIGDCDDGWQIQGGTVLCNKARFGHLWVAGEFAHPYSSIGVEWRRSYRSNLEIYLGLQTTGDPVLRVRAGLPVF